MKNAPLLFAGLSLSALLLSGCAERDDASDESSAHHHDHDHDHGRDHAHGHHHHDEAPIGTAMIGEAEVEVAQSHGDLAPGKMLAIAVKLPDSQGGGVKVRAWVGTEDRSGSEVGEGEYAPSHDDYDVHVRTPDPLPEGAMWWIEVEYPDGRTELGSIDAR
ncbi:MAG: hypothetical protein AAGH64_07835 [Planctomycetota bacterium]